MIHHPAARHPPPQQRETDLAKPNYSFEKRQREIAKKKQKEEKLAKKKSAREPTPQDPAGQGAGGTGA